MARALVTMPARAKRGEVVSIRTLIAHPMETGYRPGDNGAILPRNIIRRFTCHYGNVLVFSAELHPAVSANPYIEFDTVATESATLRFRWEGDHGFSHVESVALGVA